MRVRRFRGPPKIRYYSLLAASNAVSFKHNDADKPIDGCHRTPIAPGRLIWQM
jgi:hypothetical protein